MILCNFEVHILVYDFSHSAGGDLTAFVVERGEEQHKTIELLMCGNGQWGGLGSNSYSNAQSAPLRVKNLSGLVECEAGSCSNEYSH